MSKNNKLVNQLNSAIGGDWNPTTAAAPLQGYMADFPKFRSDAIVGVINDAALRAGCDDQAVAFNASASAATPDAPRTVIIPRQLAEDEGFQRQLSVEMRHTITHV